MAKTSPTQRSLKYLREVKKHEVDICEKWNSYTKTRKDLFGVLDLVSLGEGFIWGIQTTSGSGSSRIAKILAEPRAKTWLENGGRIVVHGWSKRGPRGKVKRWSVREVEVTLADYADVEAGILPLRRLMPSHTLTSTAPPPQ